MNPQENLAPNLVGETKPRYLIPEQTYDFNHFEVVYWTSHFSDLAKKQKVFANISSTSKDRRSRAAAETIAQIWLDFSRHVPTFITRAVSLTADPERQHHLIQIAYDELGGRNKKLIHSRLFLEALAKINIHLPPGPPFFSIRNVLEMLDKTLAAAASEEAIIGLLLSFEIIAPENIEMLFECLSFDETARETLSTTPFFKIHRQDETEHIRHSVANFLRFCTTDAHKADFLESFDEGLCFWVRFWDQSSRLINVATDLYGKVS